ncbi:hypothetical protein Hamer_G017879 [Homarus americanus]|uniref:Uncharacterized protein n=1 Tax=Homarus americanus TaxID=6706 RepID=A0A8J5N4V1_HOMAM|nr:hypothetical protein Hamer_G017879 [Homarus americanus]
MEKVSDSQHDFFMMLDEKIENGPDYDSETEEVERRRRLQEYADQWMTLTNTRAMSPTSNSAVRAATARGFCLVSSGTSIPQAHPKSSPVVFSSVSSQSDARPILPDEDTCGSGDITEDDEDDDGLNEPGRIPDEAVREQYMFMGNLYTLTHIRTDTDKTEPKVDVVTVPKQCPVEETSVEDSELGHKLNGSAVPEESEAKENGVAEDGGTASRPPSRPPSKSSSRPASLILRSVFPADTVQE